MKDAVSRFFTGLPQPSKWVLWKHFGLRFDFWLVSVWTLQDWWSVEAFCGCMQSLWRCEDEDWCASGWKQPHCLCYCDCQL